jgi:hypothetical protein
VVFEILWKENLQPRNVIENVEKLFFLNSLEITFLGKNIPWNKFPCIVVQPIEIVFVIFWKKKI